jgi:hypothetical protein
MDLEEMIQFWGRVGLIDGLPEELKGDAAMTYEKTAKLLIANGSKYNSFDIIQTIVFSVIYRTYKKGLIIKNVPDLIEKLNQFLIDNREVMSDLHGVDFDVEAEMCYIFSEDYCEWIIDNPEIDPIKYIPKHKL